MNILHITEENFERVEPSMLLDPKWYPEVEAMVMSIDAAGTADYAKDYGVMLARKMDEVGDRMPQELSKKYFTLLKALRLYALPETKDREKEIFFDEMVLDVLRLDFVDIKGKIDLLFRGFFNDQQYIENSRGIFVRALEKNQESLGEKNLQVDSGAETKVLKPTVANWLADYNFSSHVDQSTRRRGSFEQTNYLLHSLNVKNLNKDDKEVLQKLIQLYDWLRFEPLKYNFQLPGEKSEGDEFLNFITPEKTLPDDLIGLIEQLRSSQVESSRQVQGLNYMSGQNGVMEEEPTRPKPVPPQVQKPVVAPPARPPVLPPVNKKPEEPRTLMDIKADIENKRRKAQEEIDRKLEELRRKVQK